MITLAIAIGGFVVLMLLGVPIFAAIGLTTVALFFVDGLPLMLLAQIMVDRVASPGLLPVPFFVIAAMVMLRGGIANVLVDTAEAWLGGARGGAAYVCVAAAAFFATISGSSVATAVAMGTVLLPIMLERGYERHFSLGVIASAGTLGILIPPSIAMIIYGIVTDASVPRMFLAGFIPGIMQALLIAGFIAWYTTRHAYPRGPRMSGRQFLAANLRALPALTIPGVIFASIYGGIATVTEAAALSVAAALVVSLGFYRGFSWREVPAIFAEGIYSAAAVTFIVGSALIFGQWVIQTGIPQKMVAFVIGFDLKAWQFLLVANLVMLVLGMFFDGMVITLLVVPLILPILIALKIDLIHFAIILVINMEIGLLTPPFGMNLFTIQMISGAPINEVVRGVGPFILVMLVLLMIITFIPDIPLFLPRLVFGS
jgi:C4-dicarboxylate transporter, DctM subunit